MILMIDNYDSFTYNLVHYAQELGADVKVIRNDDMSAAEAHALGASGVILSPGPRTPDDAGIMLDFIKTAPDDLPIFGVCLGQQAIGQAFGGKVIRAKAIMHGKVSPVFHDDSGLMSGLNQPFNATRYHSLAVERHSLPDCLRVNGWTQDDEIMSFYHISRPIHGVQFHPESIASEHGHDIIKAFLELTK
ncbi:anthranilate synthase component II [Robiginitomaculum antarcticum]|uniref:anthranilate synthase component II n=1 Tax=Robiginitomaculum antarcticum TaxID=437507 RepID=UPI000369DA8C|nr:aminodeoxychorismate/anthranilate synthase component II [Robiginitomaculum antarcticum]